jgi:N-formylmaleamate deformylase
MRREPHGTSGFAEVDGLRLHHLSYGSGGPAILLVPGITSPAITWEFVAEALALDRAVHTLDVRGRGLSDRAPRGAHTLEDYAADVAGLARALGLVRPVLLGHSMGARIVAAAAADYPGLAGAVVAVDPPMCGPGRDPYPFPLQPYLEALHQAQRGATAEDMRAQFPNWTEEQLQLRAEWLATCDEVAVVESYMNFHVENFLDWWRRCPPPALFVYGRESPVVPESAVAEVAAANPDAAHAGVDGAGHMIPWDNLADFVTTVRGFLTAAVSS